MKVITKIIRTYEAIDGKIFNSKSECYEYEMGLHLTKVGKSSSYVIGIVHDNGGATFFKYRKHDQKYYNSIESVTHSAKYASKFKTFEEAYKVGGEQVMTIEQANKI